MNRQQAWEILTEHVKSESLRRHCHAVESAMVHFARLGGHDEQTWSITGLLHDFDYEAFPNPPDHTREGAKILRQRGVPDEIIDAILSHADWNLDTHPRDTPLRKTLYAVDELCGFIHAVARLRPTKLEGLTAKSVKKKMKQASFAAAVNRQDIIDGAVLLDLELDALIGHCVEALSTIADQLDLKTDDGPAR
jgi:putative nucleotidyltransferase with HDIG domain